MSDNLLITVITTSGSIIVAGIGYAKEKVKFPQTTRLANCWRRALLHGAIGALITGFLAYLLANLVLHHPSCFPWTSSPHITITSPSNGNKVPQTVTVQVDTCNIQSGQKLWIFVKSDTLTLYYPQSGPIEVTGSDSRSINAYIGDTDSVGFGFQVLALLADQETSIAIEKNLKQLGLGDRALSTLPSGILMTHIHVTRE